MRPVKEKPIDTMEDLFERGQKLWVDYFLMDPNDPEAKDCFLFSLIHPKLRDYVREKNSSFPFDSSLPQYVLDDIQENGGTFIEAAQPGKDKYITWRRAKENPLGSVQYLTFYTARKQIWKSDWTYWQMRLMEFGINTKILRMELDYEEFIDYSNQNTGNLFLLDLEKVSTMFIVLLVGLIISLVIFIMEMLISRPVKVQPSKHQTVPVPLMLVPKNMRVEYLNFI